jgi:hypothetical protein
MPETHDVGRLVRDELGEAIAVPGVRWVQARERDDRSPATAVGPSPGPLEERRAQARRRYRDRAAPPSGVPDRTRRVEDGVRWCDPRVADADRERRIEVGGHGGTEADGDVTQTRGGHDDQGRTLRRARPLVFHRARAGSDTPGVGAGGGIPMVTQPGPAEGLRTRMASWIERLLAHPLIARLDPYLGVSELRRINPLLLLIPVGVMSFLGARTSQFGHMDTVGGIFPIISLISALNPFVGLLSGLAYAGSDFVQKFITDDVFYEGARTTGDYWGARFGYLLAYSSMIMFGLVPGIVSRIGGRIGERVVRNAATRSADVAEPTPKALRTGRVVGRVVGAAAGGLGSAVAYQVTAAPAFLARPSPDHSCYILSRSNVRNAIPGLMAAAGLGAVGPALTDDIGSDAQVGDRPEDEYKRGCERLRQELDAAIDEYHRYQSSIDEVLKAIDSAKSAQEGMRVVGETQALVDSWKRDLAYYRGKASWYWSYVGWWAEGAASAAARLVNWAATGVAFVGAIGWSQADRVRRFLIMMGMTAKEVAKLAGRASFWGFLGFSVLGASSTEGPRLRAYIVELEQGIQQAQGEIDALARTLNQKLREAETVQRSHTGEPISGHEQQSRYYQIQRLYAELRTTCPEGPQPNRTVPSSPPVRGLPLGWEQWDLTP